MILLSFLLIKFKDNSVLQNKNQFFSYVFRFQFDTFIFVLNIYNYDVEGTGNVFTESKCT